MKFNSTVVLFKALYVKRENCALNSKNSEILGKSLGVFPVNLGHFSTFKNVGKHIAKSCL